MNATHISSIGDLARASQYMEPLSQLSRRGQRRGGFWPILLGALGAAGVPMLSQVGTSAGKWIGHNLFGRGVFRPGESLRKYGRRSGGLSFRDLTRVVQSHGPAVWDVISRSGSSKEAAKNLLSFTLDSLQSAATTGADRGLSYLHRKAPGWIRDARSGIRRRWGFGIPPRHIIDFDRRLSGIYPGSYK